MKGLNLFHSDVVEANLLEAGRYVAKRRGDLRNQGLSSADDSVILRWKKSIDSVDFDNGCYTTRTQEELEKVSARLLEIIREEYNILR